MKLRYTDFSTLLVVKEIVLDQGEALLCRGIPIMATLKHTIINCGRKMGRHNTFTDTEDISHKIRQKIPWNPNSLIIQPSLGGGELCNQVSALSIPRVAIQRQSSSTIQRLIHVALRGSSVQKNEGSN